MIHCKVLKNLLNLQQKPREDTDVVEDIDYLVEKLQLLVSYSPLVDVLGKNSLDCYVHLLATKAHR